MLIVDEHRYVMNTENINKEQASLACNQRRVMLMFTSDPVVMVSDSGCRKSLIVSPGEHRK